MYILDEIAGHLTGEDLDSVGGVGGTPAVGEESCVVGPTRSLVIEIEQVAKTHRHQCCVKSMFERESHAQIGCQAKGGDDLRGADSLRNGF